MGEAKRRGTREQRIAQSIERQKREDAARSAEFKQREAERIAAMKPQERREAVLAGGGGSMLGRAALMAASMAAAAPVLIVSDVVKRRG